MKLFKQNFFLTAIAVFLSFQSISQALPSPITLPNGWRLSPAGTSFTLGDLPLNLAVSPDEQYIAVTNNGQSTQSLQLVDVRMQTILDESVLEKSWFGLQFSSDSKYIYLSGGHDNRILKYTHESGKLRRVDSFMLDKPWPTRVGPAGLALDAKRQWIYVVTREDKQLYIIDELSKKIIGKFKIGSEAYDCKLSRDGKELYVSCWGCDKILIFDIEKRIWSSEISVGDNPNEMLLSENGKLLYVCNANDNSVSVIDLRSKRVIETLDAAMYPNSPSGSTSNSLAMDTKTEKLFIANADNNCIAVFDISKPGSSRSEGFIPVGWYPTTVRFIGKSLWVANGKGMTSKANPFGPSPVRKREEVIHHGFEVKDGSQVEYIGGLFKGSMSVIPIPDEKQLNEYTAAVYRNSPFNTQRLLVADSTAPSFPIPTRVGNSSPIKYVFYVIKENRTYDQVLADIEKGNGDTSLLLFGRNITPNQHALAEQFVLLDNFYVDAEVSADGHNWTMGALANDYLEKTWPSSYGGRGGTYGGEGEREIANNKGGFFWDNCARNGVSFRTYGEFMDRDKPNLPVLKGNNCSYFPSYDLSIADTVRFKLWKRDFDSLLAIDKVPSFNSVRFGNDHTEGLRLGRPSPFVHVADNDLAVGMFVEALAKSKIWNETAIFIIEDDAQNGADHVDAHRSTAYLAGGFVKRGFVDHTPYSTSSMLRTMELILGLPPMTQYDAGATSMWRCFDSLSRPFNFQHLRPNVDMQQKNTAKNEWQRRSEKFNFAVEDSNNDIEFNRVLWHGIKGERPFPGPRRAGFVFRQGEDEDDDD
ncbi:MAG: bifunctional YncE family protein/alkaline phosphatase family protein [Chitinophagaceae bacterium]|jgi:YVTN family beta-propeller protein